MKTRFPLLFFMLSFYSITLFSQQEICENKDNSITNTMTLTKCEIQAWKGGGSNENSNEKKSRKVSLNISSNKRRNRVVKEKTLLKEAIANKKIEQASIPNEEIVEEIVLEDTTNNEEVKNIPEKVVVKETIEKKEKLTTVLFTVVDEIPLFPKCKSSNNKAKEKCFNKEMSKHFAKNFYPERASEDGVIGKAFVQFIIDEKGTINNVKVGAKKSQKLLVKELKRVISLLPNFIPGKHNGNSIKVKYSLPLNFN